MDFVQILRVFVTFLTPFNLYKKLKISFSGHESLSFECFMSFNFQTKAPKVLNSAMLRKDIVENCDTQCKEGNRPIN